MRWAHESPVSPVLPTEVCNFHAYMRGIDSSSVHLMPLVRSSLQKTADLHSMHTSRLCNVTRRNSVISLHIMYSVTSNNRQNAEGGKSSQKPIAFMRLLHRCMLLPNNQCCPIQRRVWPLIWHSIGGLHTNRTSRHVSHKAQRHVCCMALLL